MDLTECWKDSVEGKINQLDVKSVYFHVLNLKEKKSENYQASYNDFVYSETV